MAKENSKNQETNTETSGKTDDTKNASEGGRKLTLPSFTNSSPPESSKDLLKV